MQRILPVVIGVVAASGLRAQFSEAFDSQAAADVSVVAESDTSVTYVDYSNMTVGATNWSIPEAPRRIGGSAPTRGVLVQCNTSQGAATGCK